MEVEELKLLELHIYGYGKIENKHYRLGDIQLFYGENEAGKSTIMSFIHSILFGFPTKQQSLLRYVPKSSSTYGGKLLCEIDSHGIVSIERTKGKATGDVTIQFEDGRTEGEETLQQLLGKMDRATYQNIFSFNLEGLQNIQRLKKEELNRYLFSAGSTGTDFLLQKEQDWQKEREQLFKKSGRKPRINMVLTELKSLEKDVREGKEKNEQYGPLIVKRQLLEERILSQESERDVLAERRENLVSVNENWDTLVQFREVKERLSQLADIEFPSKGLERLNELKSEERQLTSYLETLTAKQENLLHKLESEDVHASLRDDIPFMEKMLSQQAFYLKWKEEGAERNRELKNIRRKINETIRELGLQVEMEDIPKLDTGLTMFEHIQQALDRQTKLIHELESLQRVYEGEEEERHTLERKCEILENRLMEEDEYQELQRKVKAHTSQKASHDQIQWLNMQVKDAEERYRRKKSSFSKQLVLSAAALLLLLGLGAWSGVNGNSILSGVSLLIVLVICAIGMLAKGNLREESRILQRTKARAKELRPGDVDESYNLDKAEHNLKQQMEYRNEWKQRILSLEEQEVKINNLRNRMKEVEKAILLGEEEMANLKEAMHLPSDFHWKWLRDAFTNMKELVGAYETYGELNEEEMHVVRKMNDYEEESQKWFKRHSLTFTTIEEALMKWKSIIQEAEKRQLTNENIDSELEYLSFEIEKHTIEERKIRDEIKSLLLTADCSDEMYFREKALKFEEKTRLSSQYSGMKTRLTERTFHTFLEFPSLEESRKELSRVSKKIDGLLMNLSDHQKELASLSYEIKMLEEGKSYSGILQEFQSKKAELQELAYDWSKYTVAQMSLKKTMEMYQKTKMPKVLEMAEDNFRELTEGHYYRMYLLEDEMIKVERKDGEVFHAVELSQGTKEQLYIAIRFALIQSFHDKYSLPVLIDDGVVNFDRERTNAFLTLLRKMARQHQVLLFTCHPHIKEAFTTEETILLKRMGEESITNS
ncbi:hypothetical protein FGG79_08880 [Bacillus sp. BHET2]|nr:hypothetical protein FGG79_08880 [Bacillus sp. BHET2]